MKLLVVEDEERIAAAIKKGLTQEHFSVDVAYDGESGYDLAEGGAYDLFIFDIMMPKMDGITLAKKLRSEKIQTPILFLTARGQISEKVEGLDSGGDDYLVKPFAFEELTARIRALIRRPPAVKRETIAIGDVMVDIGTMIVSRGGKVITLTRKEYTILEYLMRNAGRPLSKQNIITHAWEYDADVLENTVEVNIRNLRRKLGKPEIIRTARGFGYTVEAGKK